MRNNSWSLNPGIPTQASRLEKIITLKPKRGYPVQFTSDDNGYYCLSNVGQGNSSAKEMTRFSKIGRCIGVEEVHDMGEGAYIKRDGNTVFKILQFGGNQLHEIAYCEDCRFGDADTIIFNDSKLLCVSSGVHVDLTSQCGYIGQVVEVKNKTYVKGSSGLAVVENNLGSISVKSINYEKASKDSHVRFMPMSDGGIVIIEVQLKNCISKFTHLSSDDESVIRTFNSEFNAMNTIIGNIFCSGSAPYKNGIVVYGIHKDPAIRGGDFAYDFDDAKWKEILFRERRPCLYDQKVGIGGYLVQIHASYDRCYQLILRDFRLNIISQVPIPDLFPLPSKPRISGVTSNGFIIVTHGKMNRIVEYYRLKE